MPIELAALVAALTFVVGVLVGVVLALWAEAPKLDWYRKDSTALRELADARDAALRGSRSR